MVERTTSGANWHTMRRLVKPTDSPGAMLAMGSDTFRRAHKLINEKAKATSGLTKVQTFRFTEREIRDTVDGLALLRKLNPGRNRRLEIVEEFFRSGIMKGNI